MKGRTQSGRNTIAKRIVDARRTLGLSRGELANLVGVDVTAITGWENGKYRPREGAHRTKLASALNLDVQQLHTRGKPPANSSTARLVDALDDFPGLLENLLKATRRSVKDVRLASPYVLPPNTQVEFRRAISARILDGTLEVLRVEIFYSLARLKEVLANILLYHGHRYHVRSYCPGIEEVAPALGGYAFDDSSVVLGGYFVSVPPHRKPGLLLRGPAVREFFQAYWDEIWRRGTPLNLGGSSDLSAVRALATRLGLEESQWNKFLAEAGAYKSADGAPFRI